MMTLPGKKRLQHGLILLVVILAGGEAPGDPTRIGQRAKGEAPSPLEEARAFHWPTDTLFVVATHLANGSAETSLDVSVESAGSNRVVVTPGSIVEYQIVGLLSDDDNEGLALFGLDLLFDGGDLEAADTPVGVPTPGCDNPMINFTRPWGITNPDSPCPPSCGYGGTLIDGMLVQVGGGQNTINNTPDDNPFPIGPVLTGVAQSGICGPAVLVTGSLAAPSLPGRYRLTVSNVFANIILPGETGDPIWAAASIEVGGIRNLTIIVKGVRERQREEE